MSASANALTPKQCNLQTPAYNLRSQIGPSIQILQHQNTDLSIKLLQHGQRRSRSKALQGAHLVGVAVGHKALAPKQCNPQTPAYNSTPTVYRPQTVQSTDSTTACNSYSPESVGHKALTPNSAIHRPRDSIQLLSRDTAQKASITQQGLARCAPRRCRHRPQSA